MKVALTGVPGTGKTKIAGELGKRGFEILSLNKLVEKRKLWKGIDEFGSKLADIKKLALEANKLIKGNGNWVVEGHLACEMKLKCELAIVCRTRPAVLERRLRRRGYPQKKLDDNLMCELLDYCTIKSLENYRKVYEIETSSGLSESVSDILGIISGEREDLRAGWVSWEKELMQAALKQK